MQSTLLVMLAAGLGGILGAAIKLFAAMLHGQKVIRVIESVHWARDTAWDEDASTGYTGNGPQVMATLRNRHQPALPRRRKRGHPDPPGHRA
jgi:hypothetical protein